MPDFTFTVTVTCDTSEEAESVMTERFGFDDDYGFEYSVNWDSGYRRDAPKD